MFLGFNKFLFPVYVLKILSRYSVLQPICSIRMRIYVLALVHGWWQASCPKVPMVRAGNTGTIPFGMRGYERQYYPGGKCDSAADKGDGSRLWYVNTWAMKWSQKE
jgi:hypothetical protein